MEQEEKKYSSCLICQRDLDKRKDGGEYRVVKTERESYRGEEKWQVCWCCRD